MTRAALMGHARPYCNDGPASVAGGSDVGARGTGADTPWGVVRSGAAAARAGAGAAGLRCAGAAAAPAAGVRAGGVSGSGVMMLTGGIELADGKS